MPGRLCLLTVFDPSRSACSDGGPEDVGDLSGILSAGYVVAGCLWARPDLCGQWRLEWKVVVFSEKELSVRSWADVTCALGESVQPRGGVLRGSPRVAEPGSEHEKLVYWQEKLRSYEQEEGEVKWIGSFDDVFEKLDQAKCVRRRDVK